MKSKLVCAIGVVTAFFSGSSLFSPAKATDITQTYDVEWSSGGTNPATASALITLDITNLPNPNTASNVLTPVTKYITALSLTVSGASNPAGNGTFGLSDFSPGSHSNELFWNTDGATLDLTKQLVGQTGGVFLQADGAAPPEPAAATLIFLAQGSLRLAPMSLR